MLFALTQPKWSKMKETPIKEANNEQVFRDWLMTKSHNQPIRIKYLRVQYND